MPRRSLSLILIPCVLLIHSAALGHLHPGGQPTGHDLRPHFHTNPVSAVRTHAHHHPHHHGPGGHHHHHHHHHHEDGDEPHGLQAEPISDHDANAFFFDRVAAVSCGCDRCTFDEELTASPLWMIAGLGTLPHDGAEAPREMETRTRPPPEGRSRPLYLRHLTLLI